MRTGHTGWVAILLVAVTSTALAQAPVVGLATNNHETVEATAQQLEGAASDDEAPALDPTRADLGEGRMTRGFIRHRVLHFTFDDGPRLDTTPRLLEHLDHYGVTATFFVVARGFDGTNPTDQRKAELLRDIAQRGHTIGGHTYDHSRLTSLDDEAVLAQLTRSEAIFEEVLGARPHVFRAPYGARDGRVDALLAQRGYTHVLWNITSKDVSSRTAEEVAQAFRDSLDLRERHPRGPGGVVLLHDTKPWVVDAFPMMMEELRSRNCALLETDEELWDVAGDLSLFHQDGDATERARTVELDEELVAARQAVVRAEAETYCQG